MPERIERAAHDSEQLNTGEPTRARPAASVIVLRDSPGGPEVLLVQRNPAQRFMGGLWVFPGGARSEGDADLRATAVRELEEEAGIAIGSAEAPLGEADAPLFSRWITPEVVSIRFDASFFVVE